MSELPQPLEALAQSGVYLKVFGTTQLLYCPMPDGRYLLGPNRGTWSVVIPMAINPKTRTVRFWPKRVFKTAISLDRDTIEFRLQTTGYVFCQDTDVFTQVVHNKGLGIPAQTTIDHFLYKTHKPQYLPQPI